MITHVYAIRACFDQFVYRVCNPLSSSISTPRLDCPWTWHSVYGNIRQVEHKHRAGLLRAGRGHSGQDIGTRVGGESGARDHRSAEQREGAGLQQVLCVKSGIRGERGVVLARFVCLAVRGKDGGRRRRMDGIVLDRIGMRWGSVSETDPYKRNGETKQ